MCYEQQFTERSSRACIGMVGKELANDTGSNYLWLK